MGRGSRRREVASSRKQVREGDTSQAASRLTSLVTPVDTDLDWLPRSRNKEEDSGFKWCIREVVWAVPERRWGCNGEKPVPGHR